jgi:hypothetical protein
MSWGTTETRFEAMTLKVKNRIPFRTSETSSEIPQRWPSPEDLAVRATLIGLRAESCPIPIACAIQDYQSM